MAEATLDRGEDLDRLGHHFRPDAVAREQHDLSASVASSPMPQAIMNSRHRRRSCAFAASRDTDVAIDQAVRTLRHPLRPARLVRGDLVRVAQRQPDVVQPFEQPMSRELVERKLMLEPDRRRGDPPLGDVDE